MTNRDNYVDVAKSLGIMLIICIHTEVFGVVGMPLMYIAVPAFFFMSGFYDRSERPLADWLLKTLRTLIVPAVVWIIIATAYIKLLGFAKDRSWGDNPFSWYNISGANGPAWFAFALLYAKLVMWGMLRLRLPKFVTGGVSLLVGYIGINVEMPLLIDEGCAALPLYVAGKMAYPYLLGLLRRWWLVVLGAAALCAFMAHAVSFTIVPQSNGGYSPYYLLAMPLLLLSFVPFLWAAKKLDGVRWLRALGVSSLGIMLLHAPMCHTAAVVLNRVFERGSVVWVAAFLAAYAAVVALSWWLTVLIEKHCPVLLGKRNV